uniref:Uncharacterized protein n=1 Tax=Anguilla anguilla TaxID=7936 RepID=A0A0E9UD55_ANGAN
MGVARGILTYSSGIKAGTCLTVLGQHLYSDMSPSNTKAVF